MNPFDQIGAKSAGRSNQYSKRCNNTKREKVNSKAKSKAVEIHYDLRRL
jgi:hypothetical protein